MIDPESTRQAAHVLLDAVSVHQDDAPGHDTRDDMMGIALERLGEIGAVRPMVDDNGTITGADIRRLTTAAGLVIHAMLRGWAASAKVDPDELLAEVRLIVDESISDADAD
jgi:hypothetical protein